MIKKLILRIIVAIGGTIFVTVVSIFYILIDNIRTIVRIPNEAALIHQGAYILGRDKGTSYVWWLIIRDFSTHLLLNVLLRTPIGIINLLRSLPVAISTGWKNTENVIV